MYVRKVLMNIELNFFRLDFQCPINYNPAEFYIKLIHSRDGDESQNPKNSDVDKIYKNFRQHINSLSKITSRKIDLNLTEM